MNIKVKGNGLFGVFLGCLVALFVVALSAGVAYLVISAFTYVICLAFGWGWSWMIALGTFAVICLIWFIFMPLKGGKDD